LCIDTAAIDTLVNAPIPSSGIDFALASRGDVPILRWTGASLSRVCSHTLYLAYLGFAGGLIGVFLWPAVAVHAVLTTLLTYDITRMRRGSHG
jgi:hypothetical protein